MPTLQASVLEAVNLVLGEYEPDEAGHVGEGAGLDVTDEVVGQVDGEELGLGGQHQGGQLVCKGGVRTVLWTAALHCTALHCTALHYAVLHCTVQL